MNTETIWNPRPATIHYAFESWVTGHVWRRRGKFWIVTTMGLGFIILTEVFYLKQAPKTSTIG